MNGNLNIVRECLFKDRSIVFLKNNANRTLLMESLIFKKENIAKLLIENGADIEAKDDKGWSPLLFAVQSYLPEMVKLLIGRGVDVNSHNDFGNTPLHEALTSSQGKGEIISELIKAGAKKDIRNNSGITPLQLAKMITNFNYLCYFEN
jgi:ankyrin repeat protein